MTRSTRSADCCFNALAMVAEFESDLIRARTRESMQVAMAKGRLRSTSPKLKIAYDREYHIIQRTIQAGATPNP